MIKKYTQYNIICIIISIHRHCRCCEQNNSQGASQTTTVEEKKYINIITPKEKRSTLLNYHQTPPTFDIVSKEN